MKPFAPSDSAKILEPERISGGYVLREAHARSGVALVLTGLFTVFWYAVVALSFSNGWQMIVNIIMALFGLLPLLMFFVSFQHWQQRRLLEQAELKLSTWPVIRGAPVELQFVRKLKGNSRTPNSGKLEWRITCSEVSRTDIGTDATVTHQVLWSLDLPVKMIAMGASSLEANASLIIPETPPATFTSDVTVGDGPNRFTKRKTSNWIEWQVQIETEIKGFAAPESKFALRVQ